MKRIVLALIAMSTCSILCAQSLLILAKEKDKKYGYIDATGSYVIPPRYEEAQPFNEGYAVVKEGGKYGVISTKGDYVITPRYVNAGDRVSQGKLSVLGGGEYASWGSVRMDTTMLIDFDMGMEYNLEYLSSFYHGYVVGATYAEDRRLGVTVFDSLGQVVVGYVTIEGARIGKKGKQKTVPAIYEPKVRYGRLQTISEEGPLEYRLTTLVNGYTLSIDPTSQSVYREGLVPGKASNGMIPYYKPGSDLGEAEMDTTGRKLEPIAFKVPGEMGYSFFNGIAAIEQGGVWAFIDHDGKVVLKTTLSTKEHTAGPPMYFGGLVGLFKGSKAGYINLKGDVVIPFQFTEYHPFEYDVTPVQKGKKYGLLKKDGTWAVEPKFDYLDVGPCPCFR